MKAINLASLGSSKRFVDLNSKHNGVCLNNLLAI